MNKKFVAVFLVLLVLTFFIGRYSITAFNENSGYLPPLGIVGDIEEPYTLWEIPEDSNMVKIDGKKIKGSNLESIISKSNPLGNKNDILLVGVDGFTSKIKAENLEKSYIVFSEKNGWEAINLNHPISSNVKHLKEIVIISTDKTWNIGINIIRDNENIENITVGQLYSNLSTILPYFEGESHIEKDGKTYSNKVYTQRRILTVEDLLGQYTWDKASLMSHRGAIEDIEESGYFEVGKNQIDYVDKDGKQKIENIKGIILDPPNASIRDSYDHMVDYLDDENVLFLFIDGLGYHQYEYALEKGYSPFLASVKKGEKALTVYEPVTNAGFAAMITGKTPYENGVHSHNEREFKGDSIFKYVQDTGKKGKLIGGNIGILKTEIEASLNTDRNQDGSMDDEIFDSALEAIGEGNDLLFVHFKDIDYKGHSHGDLSKETMEAISKTDGYIEGLVSKWEGKVIITSDHGMHPTDDGGNHGEFRHEDMIVPYISLEGGLSDE